MAMLIKGKQAHDAAATDNWPVPIGSTARTSLPTAVAAADVVEAFYDANGRAVVRPSAEWVKYHHPAANTVAIAEQAAAGAGIKNVCRSVNVRLSAGASAPTAAVLTVTLRDGATGAGTIKASWSIAIPAVAGDNAPPISMENLWIEGTANTAMTLEFTAAGGANTVESVVMTGTTTV